MIWHGAMALFRHEVNDEASRDDLGTLFLDHISTNDNGQDLWAIIPIFDAILAPDYILTSNSFLSNRYYGSLPEL